MSRAEAIGDAVAWKLRKPDEAFGGVIVARGCQYCEPQLVETETRLGPNHYPRKLDHEWMAGRVTFNSMNHGGLLTGPGVGVIEVMTGDPGWAIIELYDKCAHARYGADNSGQMWTCGCAGLSQQDNWGGTPRIKVVGAFELLIHKEPAPMPADIWDRPFVRPYGDDS